jgi:hypothetical protein
LVGASFVGRCHNIWAMDSDGRKIVGGRGVCKNITPGWDNEII